MLFETGPEHLSDLDSKRSVDLIRDLVWADASLSGIKKNLIDIPYDITVPDGGIDGVVVSATHESKNGIIKSGTTCYQIKSGRFSPSNKAHVDDLLFKKDDCKKLKERIRMCLEKNGTLIIALTGYDNPDATDESAKRKFLDRLLSVDSKYGSAKIEIWRQNTIIGFLQHFPALRLKLLGVQVGTFFSHDKWSRLDDMSYDIHMGPEHEKYIRRLQNTLHHENLSAPITISGDPGQGKTRMVLEATKSKDLAPLTIYVENPSKLDEISFLNHLVMGDTDHLVILVVDECSPAKQAEIWNKLKHLNYKIKLITITNELPSDVSNDEIFVLPELTDVQIDAILGDHNIPKEQRSKWVEYCKPSPRAAHVIGQNLEQNPDDILKNPDTVNIWDRFIADASNIDSEKFQRRKTVLLWLSLFKRFGFVAPFDKEAKFIADMIEKQHGIGFGEFLDTVRDLQHRKILQGYTTLYITPKIFHIKLWIEWWERYGSHLLFGLEDIPAMDSGDAKLHIHPTQGLRRWYCDMFKYASESPAAVAVARNLLGKGGLLEQDDLLLSELGTEFALTLAKRDPQITLSFLSRFIGSKNKDDLTKFEQGRREAVMALGLTSMKKNLFADSARLLLALGDAENEEFSNNASGIFKSLFSPASGALAPTEVPPSQRLPIMREALYSDSKRQRILAIDACDAALTSEFSMRIIPMNDDLRDDATAALWMPKSRNEVIDYYTSVLDMLIDALKKFEQDEKNKITSVILNNAENLLLIPELVDHIIKVLENLHRNYNVDNESIIEKITRVIVFQDIYITPETITKLEKFKDKISGSDYHSLLKTHAGMSPISDWADIKNTDKNNDHANDKDTVLKSLAKKSLDADLLRPALKWLVTPRAKNGHRFGYLLGTYDADLSLLPEIFRAWTDAAAAEDTDDAPDAFFLAGYFAAIFERDKNRWEDKLDYMADDAALFRAVSEVTRMSGMTDRAGIRILHLLQKHDDLDPADILSNFRYGLAVNGLSESVFAKWLHLLSGRNEPRAAAVSLSLFYGYFVCNSAKRLPRDMTLGVLFSPHLVKKATDKDPNLSHYRHYAMQSFDWKETGLRFIEQHPKDRMLFAQKMLDDIDSDSIFGLPRSLAHLVLDCIAELEPHNVCGAALSQIGPPIDSVAFFTRQWLQKMLCSESDAAGAMMNAVFDWADEHPAERALQCVDLLPAKFEIARKILVKYGEYPGISERLVSSFNTESFSGLASVHYRNRITDLAKLKKCEKNITVSEWLDKYMSILDHRARKCESYEERYDL